MAIREEVRDGFLGDLPEDLRVKIMNIHKLVVSTVNDVIKNKAYDPIRNTTWAKTMIDEFCIIPQDKTATGSVRLYKKGKKYACMIQLTGHVNNNRNDIDHELFHDFIRNVHQTMRTTVRRKYDMTLTCESEHGEHFEGFDVWPNHKVAKELWDKFGDMKTKKAEFHSESVESGVHYNVMTADMDELPFGLQEMVEAVSDDIQYFDEKSHRKLKFDYRQVKAAKDYPKRGIKQGDILLCVYDLKSAQITYPGGAFGYNDTPMELLEDRFGEERGKELKARMAKDNAEVQKNIAKKGNTDHQSYGERLIAVKHMDSGKQWTAEQDPMTEFEVQGLWTANNNHRKFIIRLGEIERYENRTYKSTKIFSNIIDDKAAKNDITKLAAAEEASKYFRCVEKDNIRKLKSGTVGDIAIPEGTKKISNREYINCKKITSVIMPESVNEIGAQAFAYCDMLKTVRLSKNLRKIEYGVFGKTAIESIEIPNSVIEIGSAAFSECKSLKTIKLSNNLRIINRDTFEKCSALTSVTIPESVTEIGDNAFYRCKSLKDVKILGKPTIDVFAFYKCPNLSEESKKRILELQPRAYDYFESASDIGFTEIIEHTDGTYEGSIVISDVCEFDESNDFNKYRSIVSDYDSTKELVYNEETNQYELILTPEYAEKLVRYCESHNSQYYAEKSHRKLKYEFRFVIGEDNGHLYKIVYELNPENITKDNFDGGDARDKLAKEIRKTGHSNYQSKGNMVVGITDMCNNIRVDTVSAYPIIHNSGGDIMPYKFTQYIELMAQFYDGQKLEKLKKELQEECPTGICPNPGFKRSIKKSKEKGQKPIIYKVGKVDDSETYKTTNINAVLKGMLNLESDYLHDGEINQNPITEATNDPAYNVKMSEKDAKRSLHSVSVEIINSNKPPVQYTADIYANIITKNLLPIWAGGLRKLSITLDTKCKQPIFEFKIPSMTQDFVARFIEGREPLNGLLRRNPDVKIRMSPATFKTMKDPDDAFKFFRAAIRYYESGVMKYADKIMTNFMKLDHNTKQLIATTKLGGLVTLPLQWLFQFDNVDMSDPSIFNISSTDIQQINGFIKNIYSKYAAPEKEKQKILDDLNSTIQAMREACEPDDNFRSAAALTEAVGNWYSGKFDAQIKQYDEKWITEQTDLDWLRNPPSPEIRLLQEKTQMKKLKKIPRDLVAYITIETESINDANDKMMIASYCLSKLEIVEWYIELIDVGSKRYIVPHSRPYLETLRTELLRCYSNIMKVKITPPSERPLIDIKYPKGYEG